VESPKCACFSRLDDHGDLSVRASDGLPLEQISTLCQDVQGPIFRLHDEESDHRNRGVQRRLGSLAAYLKPTYPKEREIHPRSVSGEKTRIRMLFMGPFPDQEKILHREADLRSAGALWRLLSAHWRMHDWMASFVPQLNHDLRTPLSGCQGSTAWY